MLKKQKLAFACGLPRAACGPACRGGSVAPGSGHGWRHAAKRPETGCQMGRFETQNVPFGNTERHVSQAICNTAGYGRDYA